MFRHLSVNAILEDMVPVTSKMWWVQFYCGGWEHVLKSLVFMSIYSGEKFFKTCQLECKSDAVALQLQCWDEW